MKQTHTTNRKRCRRAIGIAALTLVASAAMAHADPPARDSAPTTREAASPQKGQKIHVEGTVKSLNYTPRGDIDGAILDTGDYVHVGPKSATELKLAVDQKLSVDGTQRPMASGHNVIHAETVNGVAIVAGRGLEEGPQGPPREGGDRAQGTREGHERQPDRAGPKGHRPPRPEAGDDDEGAPPSRDHGGPRGVRPPPPNDDDDQQDGPPDRSGARGRQGQHPPRPSGADQDGPPDAGNHAGAKGERPPRPHGDSQDGPPGGGARGHRPPPPDDQDGSGAGAPPPPPQPR